MNWCWIEARSNTEEPESPIPSPDSWLESLDLPTKPESLRTSTACKNVIKREGSP
jgi:hypothetical protein